MQKVALITRRPKDVKYEDHSPPVSWLGELIGCRCGHGIGRHLAMGCEGSGARRCACRANPSQILERAVYEQRENVSSNDFA